MSSPGRGVFRLTSRRRSPTPPSPSSPSTTPAARARSRRRCRLFSSVRVRRSHGERSSPLPLGEVASPPVRSRATSTRYGAAGEGLRSIEQAKPLTPTLSLWERGRTAIEARVAIQSNRALLQPRHDPHIALGAVAERLQGGLG